MAVLFFQGHESKHGYPQEVYEKDPKQYNFDVL